MLYILPPRETYFVNKKTLINTTEHTIAAGKLTAITTPNKVATPLTPFKSLVYRKYMTNHSNNSNSKLKINKLIRTNLKR